MHMYTSIQSTIMFFLKQTQSRLPETSRVSLVWTGHTFSLKAHGTPMTPGPFPWRRGPNGTSSVAWQRRWRVYWIGRQRGQQHPILRSMFSLQFDIQHFFRGHTKKGGPNPKIQRVCFCKGSSVKADLFPNNPDDFGWNFQHLESSYRGQGGRRADLVRGSLEF